jgi:seryl-tRNA synthetase
MLDIKKIRENPDQVKAALEKRLITIDFTQLLALDQKRRDLITQGEGLKAQRNEVSAEIPKLKVQKIDVSEKLADMQKVGNQIKQLDEQLMGVTREFDEIMEGLPNIPAPDVVAGGKENNQVVEVWGQKPVQAQLNHVELAQNLGLIDYARGVKLSGTGFWIYKDWGARLEWALLNYFIDAHIQDGYEFILPPHILNFDCGVVSGQFPKFKDDVFILQKEKEQLQWLVPTAEAALINLHREEILSETELPKKYFAYTPCFRKEAGSYRASERGMIRGHQFNKVEMFQFTRPQDSEAAHQEMTKKAQSLVEGLGLHYRLVKLAAQDVSAAMAKTFDIEVFIPSMNEYKEVSSASNANDFQARRGSIRFKRQDTKKTEFVHTLNASGLATSRIIPAILEQFQQPGGSVKLPDVLAQRLGVDKLQV